MDFETIYEKLLNQKIDPKEAANLIKANTKSLNYFINIDKITSEPLNESELNQLNGLVKSLQIIYNSSVESPVSDQNYDILQELIQVMKR